ncbi:hypothetical protein JCM8547_002911 [Rhodosporidiobolus lusitaniae]
MDVLFYFGLVCNLLAVRPPTGARGALVRRIINRLYLATAVAWMYHVLVLIGFEQYVAPLLEDHLSPPIKSSCVKSGESALWSLLEHTIGVLCFPFHVLRWLACLLALLCLVLLKVAFYISPLVLLASTWAVIFYESYKAFRASKSIESLRHFSHLRYLVEEYLPAVERAYARQRLQPAINDLAANTEGGFHADFFPHIRGLNSSELLDVADDCEEWVTQLTGTGSAAEREKHLLRHVAAFLKRHALTKPERINPVEHLGLFLIHTPRALAGILVKYMLRLPFLQHLDHPFHSAYFLPILLSIPGAFLVFLVFHLIRLFSNPMPLPDMADDVDLVPSLFAIIGFSARTSGHLKLEDAKEELIFMCKAIAPDPSFFPLERQVQGAILEATLDLVELKPLLPDSSSSNLSSCP